LVKVLRPGEVMKNVHRLRRQASLLWKYWQNRPEW
jgi:hypothetical protein